ncbi:MAG: hypothetical protein QOE56_1288 [Solirubrobacterales bacterium]|jgi:hypothetical protein|nr:hypothetical protein [Solirubrobacterales bacterium]
MRKRPTLIVGLAVAITAAIVASAAMAGPVGAPVASSDGNSQAIGAVIGPKKLYKKIFTPATLEVTTKLTTSAPGGFPSPTTHVVIDFDKNAKIFTKGIPTCDPAALQSTSTEVALQKCASAKIGSGTAQAVIKVGENLVPAPATVTAFMGVPSGGKPVVLLHTYTTTPAQTTIVLIGKVSNYNKEGYGPRLDVEVPLIAGGNGALLEFNVKIDKKYKYKGEPVSFISAKCPSSKKLKLRSVFTFRDGQTTNPTYLQKCAQKPEPKKK